MMLMKKNRKYKKLIYIRIKNSWRKELKNNNIIEITTQTNHNLYYNPKYPFNKIVMDFTKKDEILKFGVKKVNIF